MRSEVTSKTRARQLEERMGGLNDSLTIGILLILIFGAVAFYLYSKLVQNEKRVGLLENLLVSLKMSTEASLGGPDSVEPISGPMPLEEVEEEEYADLLKDIRVTEGKEQKGGSSPSVSSRAQGDDDELDAEALLRSLPIGSLPIGSLPIGSLPLAQPESTESESNELPKSSSSVVDANYESMTLKELQGLAKQRGLSGVPQRKRDLIEKDAPKMQIQFVEQAITTKMKRLNEAVKRAQDEGIDVLIIDTAGRLQNKAGLMDERMYAPIPLMGWRVSG
jgi:hypothetical protein